MTNHEQAFLNGFVKRAAEYGLNSTQAVDILKRAADAPYPAALAAEGPTEQLRQGMSNLNTALGGYPGKAWDAVKGLASSISMPSLKPEFPVTPQMQEFQRTGSPAAAKAVNTAAQQNAKAPVGSVPTVETAK